MSSTSLRIGLAQFNIHWENPAANFSQLEGLLDDADEMDFLLLPEMWSTGFTMNPATAAEPEPGPALQWMKENANKRNLVIGGSVAVEADGKYLNRFYAVYPDGRIQTYDKRHLFSYGTEDAHYSSGTDKLLLEINDWKIMPIVCYDLRFPVWCRNTSDYDLMVVVANWPAARIHHWDALLRARAIENQCYVVAVNRVGTDVNALQYPGHSSIYDMNGTALMELKDEERLAIHTLDKETLNRFRSQFRFLQDRDIFTM